MRLDKAFLDTKIKELDFSKTDSKQILEEIFESQRFLSSLPWLNDEEISSQYIFFLDFFFFHLLESFLQKRKSKSKIYSRLGDISSEAQNISALFWFLCFRGLDPEMMNRIFHDKDYSLFWHQYAHWLENIVLKAGAADEQSIVASYLKNRLSNIREINIKEWLTIEELSLYTHVAIGTIYNYVSDGEIPHTKVGGLKFNRHEIDEWLKSKSFNPDDIRKQIKKDGLL